MKIYLSLLIPVFLAIPAQAQRLACTAQVTNRVYDVTLDTATRVITLKTDNGYRYEGTATYFYSPHAGYPAYFFTYSWGNSIEFDVEEDGQQQRALCLNSGECYRCR